jgi:hypothetical protein
MVFILIVGVWLTIVITRSMIFLPVRVFLGKWPLLGYLSECPLCMGTWVGIIVSYFHGGVSILESAAAVSLTAYLFYLLVDLLEGVTRWAASAEEHQHQESLPVDSQKHP